MEWGVDGLSVGLLGWVMVCLDVSGVDWWGGSCVEWRIE